MAPQFSELTDPLDNFQQTIDNELEQTKRALQETTLMLEQSQVELAKLTQRNAAITGHLQQVQSQFETVPRADIRMAYTSALDAQQRLLVMRGQLEKLQSDQVYLQKMAKLLGEVQNYIHQGGKSSGGIGIKDTNILEMVIKAQEGERLRLSKLMHDGPAQALSNFIVQTDIAARFLEIDPAKAKEELNNLKTTAMTTFQKVRAFIFELRPMMLDDLGLIPTIRRYVDAFKEQTGFEVGLMVKGKERRLESYQEVVVFRALQELLGNAAQHNADQAIKVQINVQMVLEDSSLKLAVTDNGRGFDPANMDKGTGIGLKLIRERVEMMNGSLDVDTGVGKGCRIVIQMPVIEVSKNAES